jgi:hypothetical protein
MKALTPKQRWTAIGLFAALAFLLTFIVLGGAFVSALVCETCGAARHTKEWKVVGTDLTVFRHSTESTSPLSRVLLTHGIVPAHSHQWLFAHGAGRGVKCALGEGRHIRQAAESEEFAGLVLILHQRGEKDFRDRVLRTALNPHTSRLFPGLCFNAPKLDASDAEMEGWIAAQSEFLDAGSIQAPRQSGR